MDYYALIEKDIESLRWKIIGYIREVLTNEKNYKVGERAVVYDEITHHEYAFEMMDDRILYGENYRGDTYYQYCSNIEWKSVDELKNLLHDAYHARFNYKNLK